MQKRLEELMAMRAPNQSGVDTAAVIKALADNPSVAATPTTYAYGMNVGDAQKEAQLGSQAQQQRQAAITDARNAAIQQDQINYDMAMKAHAQYLAERNQLLNERVSAAEIAYKRAMQSRVAEDIETAKLNNQKLTLELEREKQLDSLNIDVPDPANPGKTKKMPIRAFMGAGGKNILSYLTGKTGNETATERLITRRAKIYTDRGMPSDDAFLLASSFPQNTFQQMSKAIDTDIKNRQSKLPGGKPNYGTSGKDASGNPIPKTEQEFRLELYDRYIDIYFPMLSDNGRALLKQWGPGAIEILSENQDSKTPQSTFSEDDISKIANALAERYQ